MKRFLILLLTIILLLCMAGCKSKDPKNDYQISFFYPRISLAYGQEDAVISSETRNVQNRSEDLSYLIRLYLNGPVSNDLFSPFSSDTTLVLLEMKEQELFITLGGKGMSQKSQLQNTIAYACLAKTCFSLTDATLIHISSEIREASGLPPMVFDKSSIILWDDAYMKSAQQPDNNK